MLQPLQDRVVIKKIESQNTTASGIILPNDDKNQKNIGTVVAVGPGKLDKNGKRIPIEVAVNDCVLFEQYGTTTYKHENEELLVVSANDILAKCTDTNCCK